MEWPNGGDGLMIKLVRLTVATARVSLVRKIGGVGSRFRQTKREEPASRSSPDGPTLLIGAARNFPRCPLLVPTEAIVPFG